MFCRNCGKQLDDGARFCDSCGTPTGDAPVKAESTANPMLKNFVSSFMAMFSENIVKNSVKEASSKTLEWILFAAAYSVSFGLLMKTAFWDYSAPVFLLSILLGALLIASEAGGLFLSARIIFKKNTGLFEIANITGYSFLPLAAVTAASVILGSIWWPLAVISIALAMLLKVILSYAGFSKLDKFEKTPVFVYLIGMAFAAVTSAIFIYLFVLLFDIEAYATELLWGSFGDSFANFCF